MLSRLVPEDVTQLVIDDSIPKELGRPGLDSLVVPPDREALVVLGFTAGCDSTDTGFAPSLTLAVRSASAGAGHFTIGATDSDWVRTARTYACTPAPLTVGNGSAEGFGSSTDGRLAGALMPVHAAWRGRPPAIPVAPVRRLFGYRQEVHP